MRTVLFTTFTSYTTGGLHSRQSRLAPLLEKHGWRAVFALAWGYRLNDPKAFRAVYPELETVVMDGRTGTRAGRLQAIQRAIRKTKADVVIPSDMMDAFAVVEVLKAAGTGPRLVCGLTGLHPEYMALISAYAAIVDRAFGVSALTARALHELCGIDADRIDEIPTGVQEPVAARREQTDGAFRLGYVGRLVEDKRPLDLAGLSVELRRRGIPCAIDVYGEGELAAAVAEAAAPDVRFHGAVSPNHLYEHVYPSLDGLVLFSPAEGNPNAVLEALAHGVVPVCSDYAGRAEQGIVRHGETGLVFPVGDVRTAAEHVRALASDPALFARLSAEGQREIRERRSLSVMGERFAAMLNAALHSPPRYAPVSLKQGEPRSRLESLLGPRVAERFRRLARYRFPHRDHEEWPSTDVVRGERAAIMAKRLAAWLA